MIQNEPNRLSSYLWNESSFDRFLSQQDHTPARTTLRRVTARQRDDPRFLSRIEKPWSAGSRTSCQRLLEPLLKKPPTRPTDRCDAGARSCRHVTLTFASIQQF